VRGNVETDSFPRTIHNTARAALVIGVRSAFAECELDEGFALLGQTAFLRWFSFGLPQSSGLASVTSFGAVDLFSGW